MFGDQIVSVFCQLAEPFTAEILFDCLVDVVYFVKNERAEYVSVNRALATRCGVSDKRDLLGKTATQTFPPPIGCLFWEQDMKVLSTGDPILNQLELHIYSTGQTGWCVTDKFPLRGRGGRVIGLTGLSRDLHPPDKTADEYKYVAKAVAYVRENLDRRLTTDELAAVAGLSAYQLDHRIRQLFRLPIGQLVLKLRMDSAAERLRDTDLSVARVGLDCGYAGQSAFTRQFRLTTGLTPAEYRRAFRKSARSPTEHERAMQGFRGANDPS